jgi:hypothetical protein
MAELEAFGRPGAIIDKDAAGALRGAAALLA